MSSISKAHSHLTFLVKIHMCRNPSTPKKQELVSIRVPRERLGRPLTAALQICQVNLETRRIKRTKTFFSVYQARMTMEEKMTFYVC